MLLGTLRQGCSNIRVIKERKHLFGKSSPYRCPLAILDHLVKGITESFGQRLTCFQRRFYRGIRQIIFDLDVLILSDIIRLVGITVEACEVLRLAARFEL